jgi:translation initiation factor 2 beta subunit (eIF-2beta)/eIF-5
MAAPEFLICLECESPCYVFEWEGEKLIEILCEVCGNEDPDSFLTQEDLEHLYAGE